MTLAPIGLSTYARLQHVQETIIALQKNTLAKDSELYIFSDAARVGDEEKVDAVRKFLHTIKGFKSVNIFERLENNRYLNNLEGRKLLLERHGKMIFLEEDIITSPNFLSFMNHALNYYRNDPRVFAINGYMPPIIIPSDYQKSTIMLPRFAAWGFGIWKEKFDEIIMDITPQMYHELNNNFINLQQYCVGGNDAITQLWLQANGIINALDVRIDYTMFVEGRQYVICPTKSLAHSIGCDGSGEHWIRPTNKHDVEIDTKSTYVQIESSAEPDARIIFELSKFYSLTFKGKLIKIVMDWGLYSCLRYLKKFWRRFA